VTRVGEFSPNEQTLAFGHFRVTGVAQNFG
jgi:hypothetical protein